MGTPTQTIGHGSQLQLGSGSPEVFATINGVTAVDFGSNKIDTVDVTDMGSTGGIRKYIPGLENPGDVTIKLNVIPGDATQASLFAAKDGANHDWKVIYPATARTITFSGMITQLDESIPDDKQPTYSLKIQVSGPKTYS